MRRMIAALLAGWLGVALAGPVTAWACGVETDCVIGERTYRIAMPDGVDGPVGALFWAHGYKGSARATMKNKALIAFAHEQGLALVALKSASDDWLIPGVPENPAETGAVEFAYVDAVIADVEQRFGVDRDRLIASGFSAGGMMVWTLACNMGDRFRAYVPVAGTFWDPVPRACPSYPVSLVHVHGTSDKIVPIEGRPIAETHQGHVLIAVDRLVETADYEATFRDVRDGDLECKTGQAPTGEVAALCTHPGGHSLKMEYLRTGFRLLREAGRF